MSRNRTPEEEQLWFDQHCAPELNQFDDAFAPPYIPDIEQFEALVTEHKRASRKKLWVELILFWLTAVCVLSFMFRIAQDLWAGFVAFQLAIVAGAIFILSVSYRKKAGAKWKKS